MICRMMRVYRRILLLYVCDEELIDRIWMILEIMWLSKEFPLN